MIINYLNDLEVDDTWLEETSEEEIKANLEAYAESLGRNEQAWVCPLNHQLISFGIEPDWREILSG